MILNRFVATDGPFCN